MERGRSVGIIIAPVPASRKGSRGRTVIELRISTRKHKSLSLNSNSKPGGHTPRSAWIPIYTHKCSHSALACSFRCVHWILSFDVSTVPRRITTIPLIGSHPPNFDAKARRRLLFCWRGRNTNAHRRFAPLDSLSWMDFFLLEPHAPFGSLFPFSAILCRYFVRPVVATLVTCCAIRRRVHHLPPRRHTLCPPRDAPRYDPEPLSISVV